MQPDRLGTAQWAHPDTFADMHPFEKGKFWLGRSVTDGRPLGYVDDRHICLVSGNRGGKGVSTIIPNLCKWPGSLVVVDPKGENATVTAVRRGPGSDACEGMGQAVHVLDPFGAAEVPGELRASFNPLDALDPSHPGCLDDAGHLADAIVIPNPKSPDPFWDQTARQLVKTLILHVLTSPEFKGRRNLLTVRDLLLRGDHESVAVLAADGEEDLPPPVQYLWFRISRNMAFDGKLAGYGETILGMLERAPKQFESVFQVASRNTEFLDSPAMAECLRSSSFALSSLKTDPKGVSLYLSLPQRYMGEHFRWLRMILTLVVGTMESTRGTPATGHSVLMCLDEFAGLKRMEVIENAVAQIAGYGVKLMFVLQSLEQLKATYQDNWETFLSNASLKLFYSIEDHFTREYVSKLIGDTEIIRTTRTSSHTRGESTSTTEGEATSSGTSHSTSSGENWNTGQSRGQSSGSGRATNSKAWALGLRDTAAIYRAITGDRQTGTSEHWGSNSGTSSSRGGSTGTSNGTSETRSSSTSRTHSSSTSQTHGENEGVHKRPLITPDELGRFFARIDDEAVPIHPGMALVLIAGRDPAFVRRIHYFDDHLFARHYLAHPDHPHLAWVQRKISIYDRCLLELSSAAPGVCRVEWHVHDGDQVTLQTPICTVHGFGPNADDILEAISGRRSDRSKYTVKQFGQASWPYFAPDCRAITLFSTYEGIVRMPGRSPAHGTSGDWMNLAALNEDFFNFELTSRAGGGDGFLVFDNDPLEFVASEFMWCQSALPVYEKLATSAVWRVRRAYGHYAFALFPLLLLDSSIPKPFAIPLVILISVIVAVIATKHLNGLRKRRDQIFSLGHEHQRRYNQAGMALEQLDRQDFAVEEMLTRINERARQVLEAG